MCKLLQTISLVPFVNRLKRNFLFGVCIWVGLGLGVTSSYGHEFDVLVFSKTAGFRHDSIPAGIAMVQSLGAANDFAVVATEDASAFTFSNLTNYAAVIFLNTTGDLLNGTQQSAFEQYIQNGGGYVGIHSASDTEYSWPWYAGLIGAYFSSHPLGTPNADVLVLDRVHPSTSFLPERWNRTDEWYNFQTNPRGAVHILGVVDETTYSGGTMGADHPLMWCHEYDGGRSWYTAMGHTSSTYSEPLFQQHVLEGIKWAAGETPADSGATVSANYEKVVLETNVSNPMALDIAPDGKICFIERGGALKIYDPLIGSTSLAGTLSVFTGGEDGLIGIALDPGFETNAWIYLMYSPSGAAPKQHVSRFTLSGTTLDMGSEIVMLEVPTQRDECCHSGGAMRFGPNGNLFIATGDNTNPFESNGYTPIDERAGRGPWDAQKSSSNTDDLRGKILRIKPETNGTYTIPAGNLFPSNGSAGRPEVYVMGCRNPFRISVDPTTGWLYWGEVGPDAGGDSAVQGPKGYDEINQARAAGNFGWPYFIADNKAYNDYDFATSTGGAAFNPAAPLNDSPNNTGELVLPAAQPAWIWYPYGLGTDWPEMGSEFSRTAMAGPVYHYAPGRNFPAYFDQTLFIYEWSRNYIKEVKLDASGNVLDIIDVFPDLQFNRPIDLRFGPDGAIYIIEWGSGFGGNNPDAQIVKVRYNKGNSLPVAVASGTPTSGSVPLAVQFSSAGSFDPDGGPVTFEWDFDLDSILDSTNANPMHTYTTAGNYTAQLRVTDDQSESTTANVLISAGNFAPVVTFTEPGPNGFFDWGDQLNYALQVDDVEDGSTSNGTIACSSVTVDMVLGHDSHGHTVFQTNGCSGSFSPASDHDPDANVFFAFEAMYTDLGAPGVSPVQGVGTQTVQPKCKQAQYFSSASGVMLALTQDPVGGIQDVTGIDHNDHIMFESFNLLNINEVRFRASCFGVGGQVEVRADSVGGPLLATVPISDTGGLSQYQDFTGSVTDPGGSRDLYFVFTRTPGATELFNLNWICFRGAGVTVVPGRPTITSAAAFNATQVQIDFDQIMDFVTLGQTANYSIDQGVTVLSAQPSANQKAVVLGVGGLSNAVNYTVTIDNVEDLAGDTISPGSTQTFELMEDPFVTAINAGGPAYTAVAGTVYNADEHFSGGTTAGAGGVSVGNTLDDVLYQTERYGNFTYDIPVDNGKYKVTLQFSEFYWTSDGSRVFDVLAEGTQIITALDVHAQVGQNAAFDLVYGIDVADGNLTLQFITSVDNAKLSAVLVERLPAPSADLVTAINAGGTQFLGVDGVTYSADQNFSGGTIAASAEPVDATQNDTLYKTERWGAFTYEIPVANGAYLVDLKFSEFFWTNSGSRVMNVSAEGQPVITGLDLYTLVGLNVAYDEVHPVLVQDGGLTLQFSASAGDAKLSAVGIYSAAPPTAAFSAVPDSGCEPLTVTLDGSGSTTALGDAFLMYDWDLAGSPTSGVSSLPYTFNQGSNLVNLTVTDSLGQTGVISHVIHVFEADAYVCWRIATFGNDTDPIGEPGEDPDMDGMNNEDEWIAQTNPQDSNSVFKVAIDYAGVPSAFELQFPAASNRIYDILFNANLVTGSWVNIQSNVTLPSGLQGVVVTNAVDAAGFYRVQGTRP